MKEKLLAANSRMYSLKKTLRFLQGHRNINKVTAKSGQKIFWKTGVKDIAPTISLVPKEKFSKETPRLQFFGMLLIH
jgi:hypothetical protein